MRKFMLTAVLAAVFLTAGCGDTSDVEEYPAADTNYEYNIDEQEQPAPSYEEQPEPPADMTAGPRNVVAISAASQHALALMEDGTLWAWGGAWEGWGGDPHSLIGDGTTETRHRPVQIMEDVTFAMAGHHHSLAITTDGALWAWGGNWYGQLGDGTTEARLSPVRVMDDVVYAAVPSTVPDSHVGYGGWRSYAIRSDGSLWAWGYSGRVEWEIALGDGGLENRYLPVQILENVVSVVPTNLGGFALTDDGTLWRWHGETWLSAFEDGEWIQTEIENQLYPAPVMENVASLSSCAGFAITDSGQLWSLGLEPAWVMDDVVYATGLGGANFVITTDGTLWAWGRNRLPDHWRPGPTLGDGTTVDRDAPVRIMENSASVTAMGNTAYAITKDGTLWGWGNSGGNWGSAILIGDGSLFSWDNVEDHMWEYALDERGFESGRRWLIDDDGDTGLRLSPVRILENVVSVAPTYYMLDHGWVNSFRTFALTECGSVWAWGENDIWDQGWSLLGDGTSEHRLYPVRIIGGG